MAGSKARKEDRSARLIIALHFLDKDYPLYNYAVRLFVGGGPVSILLMRELADAWEMGLGGPVLFLLLLLLFRHSAKSLNAQDERIFTLNGDRAPPAAHDSSEVARS